jgi:hypothetical protein
MSLSSMYHFSTSVISGGLPLASSHPSTAYFWFDPFSMRIPANRVFVWCLYASSVLTRTIKLAERSFPMRQTLDLLQRAFKPVALDSAADLLGEYFCAPGRFDGALPGHLTGRMPGAECGLGISARQGADKARLRKAAKRAAVSIGA